MPKKSKETTQPETTQTSEGTTQTETTQTFKNEHLNITMKKSPGCLIELEIDISPKAVKAAHKKAIKNINKEVSIPGFRKGKAPDAIILKNYKSHIDKEWQELSMQTTFNEALELTKTYPYRQESVKRPQMKNLDLEKGGKLLISFEGFPDIPEIDPKSLSLPDLPKTEITDEDIEKSVEDIQYQHASWEEVTDRPLEDGDYATLTILNIDEEPHKTLTEETRFHTAKGKMGEWMRKLILGLNTGEQAEGKSKNENKEIKEFKPTKCRITVNKIETATLPERNDELAEKVSLKSYDELLENVKKELERMASDNWREEMRHEVQKLINTQYPYDIPSFIVEPDIKNRTKARIAHAKKELGDKATDEKLTEIEKEVRNDVLSAYRMLFLAKKVSADKDMEPNSTEITMETMKQLYMTHPQERIIDQTTPPEEAKARIHSHLLLQKVKDYFIDEATLIPQEKA